VRRSIRLFAPVPVALLAALSFGACSSSDDDSAESADVEETSTTTVAEETGCTTSETGPMRILLVNDDGMINPAIDVLIEALEGNEEFDTEVTVVAPADERSGSSDKTTPEGATYEEATTPGGNEGYAVDGFPADAVIVALDQLQLDPQLVLSGINPGQNIGPFAEISGTVGVGRTAIRRDIPALAVSAGIELDQAQFDAAADLALDWIEENCEALVDGTAQSDTVTSINVPACPPAQMGELQAVERALEFPEFPEGQNAFTSSCDLSDPAPATDVAALIVGYPSITQVPADF
jgi:5'-nucleotidase